ncbi:MAG: histidine phosphatase family protein [Paracoccaceae bacterium]|nr:MAG: histidine phosphatase family protein [Paracoccaceae bacterium]
MTRFWWVRHGPTHARAMTGWTDLPADLSDTAALSRLSAALPATAVVVSSDLRRAVATADAIQGPRRRLPHDPRLREIHFGAWEGLTADQAAARDPGLTRAFWNGDPVAPPGGESWADLSRRLSGALSDLTLGGDVVVVAHFGAILAALQIATGAAPGAVLSQRIETLSLTRIATTPSGWQVAQINHVP